MEPDGIYAGICHAGEQAGGIVRQEIILAQNSGVSGVIGKRKCVEEKRPSPAGAFVLRERSTRG